MLILRNLCNKWEKKYVLGVIQLQIFPQKCFIVIERVWQKEVYGYEYMKQSFFLYYYYVLIIVWFSI